MRKKYDAILIPGGGLDKNGNLPPWTKARLDCVIRILRDEYIIVLSAGTTHKPPVLNSDGFLLFESTAAANYLIKEGVKREKILIEASSYDTIGNAFFSRMIHCEVRNFKRLLIITSSFHMHRTKRIFRWIYGLSNKQNYNLYFKETSDVGLSKNLLKMRITKEKDGAKNLLKTIKKIKSLSSLHKWMYTEHSAYATGINKPKIKKGLLKTY